MIYIYIYIYIYINPKPVTPNAALCTQTHLATAVLPLFKEPLEVLFVMSVGPAVALCLISRTGDKGTESVLESR